MVTLEEFQIDLEHTGNRSLAAGLAGPRVYPLLADYRRARLGHLRCLYCPRALRTHLRGPFRLFRDAPPLTRHGDVCSVCRWKSANDEACRMVAFRLWPSLLEADLWPHILAFLCREGSNVRCEVKGTRTILASSSVVSTDFCARLHLALGSSHGATRCGVPGV